MKTSLISLVLLMSGLLTGQAFGNSELTSSHGTILVYHHVSEHTPPSTTISPEKFKEHLLFLKANHSVVPLTEMIEKLKSGQPLPDMAVAITFDDGFANILKNAHPLLLEFGFPYTIFVNPDTVGSGKAHISWPELKTMSQQGALIANHYLDHRHMLQGSEKADWLKITRQNILAAEAAIEEKIGFSPGYLAYPFGEYNAELADLVNEMGLIGFAQHSGGVGLHTDFTQVPRFPAAGIYSNLKTLKVKLSSLAMPVLNGSITDPAFYQAPELHYSLEIDTGDFYPSQLTCFFRGKSIDTSWSKNRVTVSSSEELKPGRSRVNCTAPSKSKPGRFYWHSQPWFIADKNGLWLD